MTQTINKAPKIGAPMTLRRLLEILEARGDNLAEVMDYPLFIGVRDYYGNYERVLITEDYPPTNKDYGEITLPAYLDDSSLRQIKKKIAKAEGK